MWVPTVLVLCLGIIFCRADHYDERNLTGKFVVVTGGSNGIGHAICQSLLQNNVKRIFIVDIDQAHGKIAESTFNTIYGDGKVVFYHGDIRTDLDEIFNYISVNYGYVDVLINNAGVCDEYDIDHTFQVNALGPIKWSLKFFEAMRKDRCGRGGTIINISSLSAYLRDPFIPIYKASKAAVLNFSYGLGHAYTHEITGVRILAVCPGLTKTAMTDAQMVVDGQVEIWEKFKNSSVWQGPQNVGNGVVNIFKNGDSGTAWTIAENKEPVISPDKKDLTASMLKAL